MEKVIKTDIAIIGGGPAGMAAAVSAYENGARDILIIERASRLGGILEQCIHHGFGLHKFKKELTGPEYAQIYEDKVDERAIKALTGTMVVGLTPDKEVKCVSHDEGEFTVKAKAVVLAMGCRERPRGALNTPGTRPAGVYTAGTAQKLVNLGGYMPGKKIVILGSGDIGLIMARRMQLEGGQVLAVCEILPDSGGLTRNIVQCLNDFDIPLKLNTTVTEIHGRERLEGVTIAKVDEKLNPIAGTEEYIECDTLMLSVGLVPENELTKKAGITIDPRTRGPVVDINRQTSVPGIFAAGNVVKVHELVDYVSNEAEIAGESAALFALGKELPIERKPGNETVQHKGVKNLSTSDEQVVICTVCPMGCKITVKDGVTSGNTCKRGEKYALKELSAPERTLTTTMRSECGSMIPVRSDKPIPREKVAEAVKEISKKHIPLPVENGAVVISNILGTDANIIATRTIK